MTPKAAMRFLLWYGNADDKDHVPSEEETTLFHEARGVSATMAKLTMNLKPHHYAYTPGQSYQELLDSD